MQGGWKLEVLFPLRSGKEPARIHYLAAISDEKEAKRVVAKSANVSAEQIEVVAPVDHNVLLDFGLETGEVIRLEYER